MSKTNLNDKQKDILLQLYNIQRELIGLRLDDMEGNVKSKDIKPLIDLGYIRHFRLAKRHFYRITEHGMRTIEGDKL